jgi:hypothetical protein
MGAGKRAAADMDRFLQQEGVTEADTEAVASAG